MRPADTDLLPWIALTRVEGLGCVGCKKLADHFGDPTQAFSASRAALAEIKGLSADAVEALVHFSNWDDAEDELRKIQRTGVTVVPFTAPQYPVRLRAIADPPPFLYVKGELQARDEKAVAVVGSRSASDYGRRVARDLCRGLASMGFTVVSGMARGIDGTAHETTLECGGRTLAVLGSGVDRVYPPEHVRLYQRIADNGAVLSELPVGTRPLAHHFPARNRLISGLSAGVVVVEATEKSGSLITAELALDQGREVFAVPGEVGASRSRGAHKLIRQGAKLVESVADIIEEIAPQMRAKAALSPRSALNLAPNVAGDVRQVLELLQDRSLQIDEVIEISGLAPARISEILLHLELQGFLKQLPGNRYIVER